MNGYRITEARQDDLTAIVDIYNSTINSRLATADLSPDYEIGRASCRERV